MPSLSQSPGISAPSLADAIARLNMQSEIIRRRMGTLGNRSGQPGPDPGALARIQSMMAGQPRMNGPGVPPFQPAPMKAPDQSNPIQGMMDPLGLMMMMGMMGGGQMPPSMSGNVTPPNYTTGQRNLLYGPPYS